MNLEAEKKLWQRGHYFVVGLDEVGRGPLAGPVVAAAVCLDRGIKEGAEFLKQKLAPPLGRVSRGKENQDFSQIRDSKKFSAKQREQWYKMLIGHPNVKWGIGLVSEKIIDKINILEATKLAMKRAVENLKLEPDYLLLDGNFLLEDLPISQKAVIRGDEKIWSCAAASVIAKVVRDGLMREYHQKFPAYGFDKHKGYGTREHIAAIKKHGLSPLHRKSFHIA